MSPIPINHLKEFDAAINQQWSRASQYRFYYHGNLFSLEGHDKRNNQHWARILYMPYTHLSPSLLSMLSVVDQSGLISVCLPLAMLSFLQTASLNELGSHWSDLLHVLVRLKINAAHPEQQRDEQVQNTRHRINKIIASPLWIVDNMKLINFLLESGADPNHTQRHGEPTTWVLLLSYIRNHLEEAKRLGKLKQVVELLQMFIRKKANMKAETQIRQSQLPNWLFDSNQMVRGEIKLSAMGFLKILASYSALGDTTSLKRAIVTSPDPIGFQELRSKLTCRLKLRRLVGR